MRRNFVSRFFLYAILIIVSIISIFPFYWMIVGMTNPAVDVIRGKMTFGSEFFNNMSSLFSQYNLTQILTNSITITGLTVAGTLIVCSMAAYGFEMFSSPARERVYSVILLSMMVPFAALMIPLFKLISKMGLLNSLTGVILASIGSVFILFFFRQSFKSFPYEIIQAGRVDGAGEMTIFFKLFLPSMKSTYAAAAIYSFTTSWNSYLWPLLILQTDDKKTITLTISSMSSAYVPQYGVILATIVIATLPSILVFFGLQKHFVQGMLGSVKQ